MAKQAQSSSQLTVPQVMMRPIWPQLRRTAVIQAVIAVDQDHGVAPGPPGDGDRQLQGAGQHGVERALVDEERPDAEHDDEGADQHGHEVEAGALLGGDAQTEDGEQRQAHRRGDQRPGERPHGQRVVGAEAAEPAEPVDRRDRVADGQRVGDGLRRERQLDQRRPGARRCPALRSSNCMAAKQKYEAISATTAGPTHHQSNVPEDGAEAIELRALRGEHPQRDRHQAEADDDARSPARPCGAPGARRRRRPGVGEWRAGDAGAGRAGCAACGPRLAGAGPSGRVPTAPTGSRAARAASGGGGALPGPGVGEPLPGQLQRLGHDAGLGHRRHEVGVAGPARQDVQMDVRRQARRRPPGPGWRPC